MNLVPNAVHSAILPGLHRIVSCPALFSFLRKAQLQWHLSPTSFYPSRRRLSSTLTDVTLPASKCALIMPTNYLSIPGIE